MDFLQNLLQKKKKKYYTYNYVISKMAIFDPLTPPPTPLLSFKGPGGTLLKDRLCI